MDIKNIWNNVEDPLELHEDDRGRIVDIFYGENINHVAVIESNREVERGNHYHNDTTQYILIIKGSLEYWYKDKCSVEPSKFVVMNEGDIVKTPPNEIHFLNIRNKNQFIVFSTGVRGGKDYESDTFRTDSIMGKIKLHLGCGARFLPGYVHVDLDPFPHVDYLCGMGDLSMFSDGSVSEIYSCGALPYFDREEVKQILKEWRRSLCDGGVLRLSVTDFVSTIKLYFENGLDSLGVLGPLFGKWKIKTEEGEKYIYQKTVYDFESLNRVLKESGFSGMKRFEPKEVFPEDYDDYSMAYVPHMDETGVPISLNIEVIKND